MTSAETELRSVGLTMMRSRVGLSADVHAVKVATARAYEDIAEVLVPLIGDAGLQALSSRALHLAQQEFSTRSRPLAEEPPVFDAWLKQLDSSDAIDVAAATFAALALLLSTFVGEALT